MDGVSQGFLGRDGWESAGDISTDRTEGTVPPAVDRDRDSGGAMARLVRTIEAEIIPRLMLAHRTLPGPPALRVCDDAAGAPTREEIAEFARLVLAHDAVVAGAYIEALRTKGMTLETVYLELLAPTARHLGELWDTDRADFTEVTVGLWRLQQVLRDLSPGFQSEVQPTGLGRRALLVPATGEQHTFGLLIVAEFFRRAGWDVCDGPPGSSAELLGMVAVERFDVIGLSVACDSRLEALAADIGRIRAASCNSALGVLVGGRVFIDNPDLVAFVGADVTAADARQAPLQAQHLVDTRTRAC